MAAVTELQAELIVVRSQISYIYKNLHLQKLEIQTQHGRTIVQHSDFQKTLTMLRAREAELSDELARLAGETSSFVDSGKPKRAIPMVYKG